MITNIYSERDESQGTKKNLTMHKSCISVQQVNNLYVVQCCVYEDTHHTRVLKLPAAFNLP